ncbi:hypothetical protein [Geomobilimonas luticola]|uniref:Uncharacterized protein n=1 Tax=Geomobilimonas luticola TaxID=1114878 RepID=A0ABS5SBG2_9BACT|nr:hypothetical protein [Geomobilimonas luticola]MBT0652701.1 hypothetical protein [Geomobilimonas luticola]
MTEFLLKYGFLIIAVLFFTGFIIWIILRNDSTKEGQEFKPTIWSYLFIWPSLLTRKEGDRTIQRGFTKREWIGWLIFALIALFAILFTPTKK